MVGKDLRDEESSRSNTTASREKTELEHRNREDLVNAFSLTRNGLQEFIHSNTKIQFNSCRGGKTLCSFLPWVAD